MEDSDSRFFCTESKSDSGAGGGDTFNSSAAAVAVDFACSVFVFCSSAELRLDFITFDNRFVRFFRPNLLSDDDGDDDAVDIDDMNLFAVFTDSLSFFQCVDIRCHRVYCICFYSGHQSTCRIIHVVFPFILHCLQAIQYHQSWYCSYIDVQCLRQCAFQCR